LQEGAGGVVEFHFHTQVSPSWRGCGGDRQRAADGVDAEKIEVCSAFDDAANSDAACVRAKPGRGRHRAAVVVRPVNGALGEHDGQVILGVVRIGVFAFAPLTDGL
jgi:hypothetical protein